MHSFVAYLSVVGLCCSSVWGQTANEVQQRSQEQERRAQEALEQRQKALVSPDVRLQGPTSTPGDRLLKAESPCFPIHALTLQSESPERWAWLLAHADGHATLDQPDPVEGRCVGAQGVQTVIDRLQNALIAKGYVTSRVLAIPQNLQTGQLQLQLILGRTLRNGTVYDWGTVGEDCNFLGAKCDPEYGWRSNAYQENIARELTLPVLRYEQNTRPAGGGFAISALTTTGALQTSGRANAQASANALNGQNANTSAASGVGSGGASTSASQGATATTRLAGQTAPGLVLPGSSLFKIAPDSNARYVVETDPRFASYRNWLSSDYMLSALAIDPATTQKRLGDGFYEQKLIREQVAALTGYRFLGDYRSDEAQYQALMTAGATFARAHQLRPGIALSAAQVTQLTSDMVWLVTQEVTLPDGSRTSALVPQVYLAPKTGDLAATGELFGGAAGTGSLISARDIQLALSGDADNSGTIAGRRLLDISAQNITNTGLLQGEVALLTAWQDIRIQGGSVAAATSMAVQAGQDLSVTTTTARGEGAAGNGVFASEQLDRMAGLYVSGPAGVLLASAGRDMNLTAAQLSNQGTGQTQLAAGGSLRLSAVQTGSSIDVTHDAQNYARVQQSQDVGTQISGQGAVTLQAQTELNAKAANVNAGGALTLKATDGSVSIDAGQSSYGIQTGSHIKASGWLASTTVTQRSNSQSTTAVASNLEGQSVSINAGQDLTVKGANVLSDQDLNLNAGRNVTIEAAQNTQSQGGFNEVKESGLLSSGGIGFTIGSRMQSLDQQGQSTSAAQSTIGAINGNVAINAGQTYTQTGSDVLTPKGDIAITAKKVDITEARETGSQSTEQKFKQSGLTVALSGGIIDTAQAAMQGIQGATGGGSDRSKALNALITYGKGADLYEQGKAVSDAYDKNGVLGNTGADGKANPGAAAASGIKVSISVGGSSTQSNSNTSTNRGASSTVKAGGNVNIRATGQGPGEGDLTVQGSKVQAAQNITLSAAKDVNIVASVDTESNRSTNKSSAATVGLSFGVGAGSAGLSLDIAASKGKGQANGDSTSYTNSQIESGQQVNITSGADTNLQGGNIQARQVTANVGGNLNVQSLQDTATSAASQQTTGVALSIPIMGGGGSASISQSKQRSNSNYQSVNEQSGIEAGEGGFQINVKNNTDLQGASIVSTASADKNTLSTGTLTTRDLQNSMSASASSSGMSMGTNMLDGKYAMGKAIAGNALNNGDASQSDASTTKTAISAAQVTVNGQTTDTSKGQLTDSNGKTVSTDTGNTNRTLAKADVAGLQQQAQQKQADNNLLFKAATAFTDPAFKAAFLDQAKMYKKVTGTDAEGKPTTQWQEMTPEEKAKIPPGSRIANNGIFNGGPNDPQAAQNLAEQNSSGAADYLVHFPQANNTVSELLVAGYQKFLEGNTMGLTNATQQNVDLWSQTGGNVTLDGHSRGGMTVGNALDAVKEQGGTGGKTNVNLYGSAYYAQDAVNTVNQITGGTGQVTSQVHKDDFVGMVLGGNAATGGTTPLGSSTLQEWIKTLGGDSTSHNNYGDGKKIPDGQGGTKSGIDDYWGGAKPVPQTVKPTNQLISLPAGDGK